MAVEAGRNALMNSYLECSNIDLIIVSTCTSGLAIPIVSCEVQSELNFSSSTCFDINGACVVFL